MKFTWNQFSVFSSLDKEGNWVEVKYHLLHVHHVSSIHSLFRLLSINIIIMFCVISFTSSDISTDWGTSEQIFSFDWSNTTPNHFHSLVTGERELWERYQRSTWGKVSLQPLLPFHFSHFSLPSNITCLSQLLPHACHYKIHSKLDRTLDLASHSIFSPVVFLPPISIPCLHVCHSSPISRHGTAAVDTLNLFCFEPRKHPFSPSFPHGHGMERDKNQGEIYAKRYNS